jgi:hypothetical protein
MIGDTLVSFVWTNFVTEVTAGVGDGAENITFSTTNTNLFLTAPTCEQLRYVQFYHFWGNTSGSAVVTLTATDTRVRSFILQCHGDGNYSSGKSLPHVVVVGDFER